MRDAVRAAVLTFMIFCLTLYPVLLWSNFTLDQTGILVVASYCMMLGLCGFLAYQFYKGNELALLPLIFLVLLLYFVSWLGTVLVVKPLSEGIYSGSLVN